MNEQRLVVAAIRIIGLWRIFGDAGNALYYVIAKDLGIRTLSSLPASTDILLVGYEFFFGAALVLAAPFISELIYGGKPTSQP